MEDEAVDEEAAFNPTNACEVPEGIESEDPNEFVDSLCA